jgi:hypothetical protein
METSVPAVTLAGDLIGGYQIGLPFRSESRPACRAQSVLGRELRSAILDA